MAEADVDVNSLELPTSYVKGIRCPTMFNTDNFEDAYSFRPHDDDIVLSTYPKCGTTWTQHIIYNLMNYDNFDGDAAKAHHGCPYLEMTGSKNIKPGSVFKTHLPFNPDTFNPNAKYLIVLRNPRDVAVSYYHFSTHIATQICKEFPKDLYWFPRYAELFVKGEVWYGDYMEYYRNWFEGLRKHSKPENVLYVVYEKMKKDPKGEVLRIANFIGGKAAEVVKKDEVIETILTRTSVKSMKESVNASMEKVAAEMASRGLPSLVVRLVRKGVVGDHLNEFTSEISKMFDEYIASDPRNQEIMAMFDV